jgi:anti-anti-sigma factor
MTNRDTWGLDVTRSTDGESALVTLAGRLSGANAPRLAEAHDQAIAGGQRRIVLNLQGVDYISSAALEVLADAVARLTAAGAALVLTGAQPPVRIALELAGIRSGI